MAVADRVVATGEGTSTSSVSYAHAVTGPDPAIFVGVVSFPIGDPSSVTYDGVSMTKIAGWAGGGSNDNNVAIYKLAGCSTGSHNVVISVAGGTDACGISISYSGVDQTTPNGTVTVQDVTTSPVSTAITSTTDDVVVSYFGYWGNVAGGNWATATSPLVERVEESNGSANLNSIAVGDAPGGAPTVTVGWSSTAPDKFGQAAFNVNQAASGPPPPPDTIITQLIGGVRFR